MLNDNILPNYDEKLFCVKCDCTEPPNERWVDRLDYEFIRRTCKNCGYQWAVSTKDNSKENKQC